MSNGLLAFAAGMGGGYLQAKQRAKDEERIDEERAMRRQKFDAEMDGVNRDKNLRISLADAARPVAVQETPGTTMAPGEMGPSQTPPTLASFKVGDSNYLDRGQADAAAATENSPEAVAGRQANAYRAGGAPEKAITLENAALTQKRSQEQYTQEQHDRARKLQEEGVFSAARALRSGDGSGFINAFNSSGKYQIEGQPVISKEERDIPGIGRVPTYTAKFKMRQPDGTVTEETRNSHDLSMQLLPFEKAMELQRKGTDGDNKFTYQSGLLDAKVKSLELAGQVAEAKALRAAAGGGQVGREERLRYTSLFSDAGRRLAESQKALTTLQSKASFMMNAQDPNSPEYQQLKDLRDSIKTHNEERSMYQGLLAGSQTPGKQPSLSDAAPKTGTPKPKATGNADFSNLWK